MSTIEQNEDKIYVEHSDFTIIPNYLIDDLNFTCESLGVVNYLASKKNWIPIVSNICKRFGWSRRTWLQVSKQLREYGFLSSQKEGKGTKLVFKLLYDKPSLRESHCVTVTQRDPLHNTKEYIHNTKKNNDHPADDPKSFPAKKTKGQLTKTRQEELFNEFWSAYPRKIAKKKAMEAFLRVIKGKPREEAEKVAAGITGGLRSYIEWRGAQRSFLPDCPHPTTWLNGERWNDELDRNDPNLDHQDQIIDPKSLDDEALYVRCMGMPIMDEASAILAKENIVWTGGIMDNDEFVIKFTEYKKQVAEILRQLL